MFCSRCTNKHLSCKRCSKDSHICIYCGHINYICDFCSKPCYSLSQMRSHSKICGKAITLKASDFKSELQKFGLVIEENKTRLRRNSVPNIY